MFPNFYDSKKVGKLYLPNIQAAAEAGQAVGLSSSNQDKHRIALLLVDTQVDFILPEGTLCVPGAVEDSVRTVEWIFKNADQLTTIFASLDSHLIYQIFYPTWWVNERGEHPAPFTPITSDDIRVGIWRPLIDPAWSLSYIEQLENQAKKVLMIWPYHTMIGSPGGAIVPALFEAIIYHAAARHSQPTWLVKGSVPRTENYSIIEPEVKVPNHPLGGTNTAFLDALSRNDIIYVAGQAKSHCVLETVRSILRYFKDQPEVIEKLRFLIDCTSSVVHPEIDFEAIANAELAKMKKQGVKLVTSADLIS